MKTISNIQRLKEMANANVLERVDCKIYGVQAYAISSDEYEVITSFEKINGRYYFVDRCGRRYLASRYERAEFVAGEILENLDNAAEAVRLSVEQFRNSGRVWVNHDITTEFEEAAEAAGLHPLYLGCCLVNDNVVNQYGPQMKQDEETATAEDTATTSEDESTEATAEDPATTSEDESTEATATDKARELMTTAARAARSLYFRMSRRAVEAFGMTAAEMLSYSAFLAVASWFALIIGTAAGR